MNRKIKMLFIISTVCVFATILYFSTPIYAFATPSIENYKLNGKQESAKFNPSRGDIVSFEISASIPVKFNTIALCVTADTVCNRATAVKYFTQTDFAPSVSKEWNGKTSKEVIVADGDYKIKVTMKDEGGEENIQELSPYIINIDSNFSGGSGGSSSSVSQSSSSGTQSGRQSSSSSASATSKVSSFTASYSSSAQSSSLARSSNVFEVSAGNDRLVYTDTPADFVAEVGVPKEFSEQAVKFIWSFGDGSLAEGKKVSHIYKFPGDYIVILNASLPNLSAVSRANMKVISPSVFISNIANEWVEITNQGIYEINLKGWFVSNNSGRFVFPTDTVIGPNKKISVPNEYMKLNLLQAGKVYLLTPSGKEATIISGVAGGGLSSEVFLSVSSSSSLANSQDVKKTKGLVASGGKASLSNSSSISKNNSSVQAEKVPSSEVKSSAKNKGISVSETGETGKTVEIFSSSTQVASVVGSQIPRRGIIRGFLNLPSAGLDLIKRLFYSGDQQ